MRIFVAGATGAIGRRLVPLLVRSGHEVVGTTRTRSKVELLRELGAEPVVVDALDASAIGEALARAEPEVVVHQLTALSAIGDFRKFEQEFAETNRLRTEGTDNLLAAARGVGVERFVAQSFGGFPYARLGGKIKSEEDPLDSDPPKELRTAVAAIRHLEAAVLEAGGIVLRYGGFYGPGTSLDRDGSHVAAVRARQFPLVGNGAAVWSFVHVDDAATATVAAIERGRPGIYNVVDDEPAPVSDWLPALAAAIGAKPPRRFPAWLARRFVGEHGVVMMTDTRGASNAKAKRELDWQPAYSWREAFRQLATREPAEAPQSALRAA